MSKHRENAVKVIAEIARASGMTFARADRLSREEAERVISWAQGNAEFMAAYIDRSHPFHAEATSYSSWPFFFAYEYPQSEDRQPVEWEAVRTADQDAGAEPAEPEGEDVFKDWTPDRARQRLDDALKDPRFAEWRAAYDDPRNPDHELAKREFTRLHEIAYPEPAAVPTADPAATAPPIGTVPAAGPSPAGGVDQAAAHRRINELYADRGFMKRYGSSDRATRAEAAAEMSAAFQGAYPEPAPPGEGEGVGGAA